MKKIDQKYHAFISYSHDDRAYASVIQKSIERLGVPFYRRWQSDVSIFRDERKIPLSGSLTEEILEGLRNSKYLIVLASRNSANSRWVKEEILKWLELNRDKDGFIKNFNFILIDDVVEWDHASMDFDKIKTTALPKFENKIFNALPIWANLQNYCKNGVVDTNSQNYMWEVAKVKGLFLAKKPDEIIDDVSNDKRLFQIIVSISFAVLFFLTGFSFYQISEADKSAQEAINERKNATIQRDSVMFAREKLDASNRYAEEQTALSQLQKNRADSFGELVKVRQQELVISNIKIEKSSLELQSTLLAVRAGKEYQHRNYNEALLYADSAYKTLPTEASITAFRDIVSDSEAVYFTNSFFHNTNYTIRNDPNSILSPDRNYYFVYGENLKKVQINGKKYTQIVPTKGAIIRMCFSANGKYFATIHQNGSVTIWDFPKLTEIKYLPGKKSEIQSFDFYPMDVGLSSDGSKIVVSREDSLFIYNMSDDTPYFSKVLFPRENINSILIPAYSDTFYLNFYGNIAKFTFDGKIVGKFRTLKNGASEVCLSNTSKYLAAANYKSDSVMVYDLANVSKPLYSINTYSTGTSALAFSLDDTRLIVGTDEGECLLFDLNNLRLRRRLTNVLSPKSINVLDQNIIVTDYLNSNLWSLEETQKTIRYHLNYINYATYSNDGELILTGSLNNDVVVSKKDGTSRDTFSRGRSIKESYRQGDEFSKSLSGFYDAKLEYAKISQDNKYVITKYSNNQLLLWNRLANRFIQHFEVKLPKTDKYSNDRQSDLLSENIISNDTRFISIKSGIDKMILYSFEEAKSYYIDTLKGVISKFDFSPNNKYFFICHSSGICIVDLIRKKNIFDSSNIDNAFKNILYAKFTDNEHIILVAENGSVADLNVKAGKVNILKSGFTNPSVVYYSEKLRKIINISLFDIELVNVDNGVKEIMTFSPGSSIVKAYEDERIIFESNDTIQLFDVEKNRVILKFPINNFAEIGYKEYPYIRVFLSRNKNIIAVGKSDYENENGNISIYNMNGHLMQFFPKVTFPENGNSIFSSDQKYIIGIPCRSKSNKQNDKGDLRLFELYPSILAKLKP